MTFGRSKVAELLAAKARRARIRSTKAVLVGLAEAAGVPADELPHAPEDVIRQALARMLKAEARGVWEVGAELLAAPGSAQRVLVREWLAHAGDSPGAIADARLLAMLPLEAEAQATIAHWLERQTAPEVKTPADWRFVTAYASVPDGLGLEALTVLRRRPDGFVALLHVVLGGRLGVVAAEAAPRMRADEAREEAAWEEDTTSVEVGLDYVCDRLAAGLEVHSHYGIPLPYAFQRWSPMLAGWRPERRFDFLALAAQRVDAKLLPRTGELLEAEPAWRLEPDTEEFESDSERERWAQRLDMAAYLYRLAKQNRRARLAATAAWALRPGSGVSLEDQPFAQRLIEDMQGLDELAVALAEPGIEQLMGRMMEAMAQRGLESPEQIGRFLESIESLEDLEAFGLAPASNVERLLEAAHSACDPKTALKHYQAALAAAERELGPKAFEEMKGHFWGVWETRPYMRARAGLAEMLWALGRHQEAIGHAREMLELNPGDNQGVRYHLLGWLLAERQAAEAQALLGRYPDDAAAFWRFGAALAAFQAEGDTARSRQLRNEALNENPHAAAYLSGAKKMPKTLPAFYGWGDENEAIVLLTEQGEAWEATPWALAWLAGRSR